MKNHRKGLLLVILTLLFADGLFAQCLDVVSPATCTTCRNNINVDNTCISCYAAPNLTDLKNTGVGPTASVTIKAVNFANASNVKVENINVYDASCNIFGGPFVSSTFNGLATGIVFTDFSDRATITISGAITNSLIGFTINFNVNVYDAGGTVIASRNYFFKVTSTSLIVGDTHITTVDGVKYDFQAVGEFVSLLANGGDNLEIQVRQTAVATSGPGFDPYTGLSTCVSVNTAVAARVGKHRVTYQPNINGQPDSTGLQLRVDGKLTELGANAIDLESGGRLAKSPAGGGAIEIDFPDGATLIVTPGWWSAYNQWYLNVSVYNTAATKGISGATAFNDTAHRFSDRSKSWLPALPDGTSLGFMPESLHERFVTLYQKFADAWRVTDATSLFDYAPGTSTATFTDKNWPAEESGSCVVAGQNPRNPIGRPAAEQLVVGIVDLNLKANAIYDVMLTGEPTFANTYLFTQGTQSNTTAIRVDVSKDTSRVGDSVTFTATVARKFLKAQEAVAGSVEFTVDGSKLSQVKLDANGQAVMTTSSLEVGRHEVAARFIPATNSTVFASTSLDVVHTVIGTTGTHGLLHQWWFWLIVLLAILGIIVALRRRKNNP